MKKLLTTLLVVSLLILTFYKCNQTSNVDSKYNKYFSSSQVKVSDQHSSKGSTLLIEVIDGKDIKEGDALMYVAMLLADDLHTEFSEYEEYNKVIVSFKNKSTPIVAKELDNDLVEVTELSYEFYPSVHF